MNTTDTPQHNYRSPRSMWTGILILGIGVLILLRRMGLDIPGRLFSWEALLIVIGIVIGLRSGFRNFSSFILIAIGLLFMARREGWIPYSLGRFVFPSAIIIAGLLILLRPRRTYRWGTKIDSTWQQGSTDDNSGSDAVDSVAIFCGSRRSIVSKNFRGGSVVNIFGGTEINLSHADLSSDAVLDIVSIFGSVKIIVPAEWEVRVNLVHIFGGTDDKRAAPTLPDSKKVLTLTSTAMFGGVDIRSY